MPVSAIKSCLLTWQLQFLHLLNSAISTFADFIADKSIFGTDSAIYADKSDITRTILQLNTSSNKTTKGDTCMKKVIILGAGMMGEVMASELSKEKDYDLTIADLNQENLDRISKNCGVKTLTVDFSKAGATGKTVADFDLIVGALPKFLAAQTAMEVLSTGVDMVEVSGLDYANKTQEEREAMENAAAKTGATIALGIGLAPGMINVLTGYAASKLDKAENATLLVGGLPVIRQQPYEYKLVFSLIGTLGQFVFPVKVVKNHKIEIQEACSEVNLIDFPNLGTLEAFTTNGLTSLMHTHKDLIPNMKEMTLRYPGHTEKIKFLRDSGLLSYDYVDFQGMKVRPVDFTSQTLLPLWKLKPGERELTVVNCDISGMQDGKHVNYHWECLDYFDDSTGYTSMARTTCFPALIMAKLITDGKFSYSGGLCHPEYIGQKHDIFDMLMEGHKKYGIDYKFQITDM